MENAKKCRTCGIVKSYSEFFKRTGSKDGLQSDCRECKRAKKRGNPKHIAYGAEWRARNPGRMKELNRVWHENNKDSVLERKKQHYRLFPEKMRAQDHLRRARILAVPGKFTGSEIKSLFAKQQGCCACCGIKLGQGYHIDHIQPISKGGSNWIENIQLLCALCNHRKKDKDPITFMQSQGFLL